MFSSNASFVINEYPPYFFTLRFILMISIYLVAISSNYFVFISFRKSGCYFQPVNVFQFNLVLSTLCFLIIVLPTVVITSYTVEWPFGKRICWLSGWASTTYFGGIMYSLVMKSIHKLCSTRNSEICFIKSGWRSVSLAVFFWIFHALLATIPPLNNMATTEVYIFSASCFSCVPNWQNNKSFSMFWIFLSFLLPLGTIIFCGSYLIILKLARFRRVCAAENSVKNLETYSLISYGDNKSSTSDLHLKNGTTKKNHLNLHLVTSKFDSVNGNNEVYDHHISPHSPISEDSTNHFLLSNFQSFPFDQHQLQWSKVHKSQKTIERKTDLLKEEKNTQISNKTRVIKKMTLKAAIFTISLLMVTAPYIIVLAVQTLEGDANNLSEYFITFAALSFYSMPTFIGLFLINSDDHVRQNLCKIFKCGSNDKKFVASIEDIDHHTADQMSSGGGQDATDEPSMKETTTDKLHDGDDVFHKPNRPLGLRKEIKLAWPSLSQVDSQSSSTLFDSDDKIEFLCGDENCSTSSGAKSEISQYRNRSRKWNSQILPPRIEVSVPKSNVSLPTKISLTSIQWNYLNGDNKIALTSSSSSATTWSAVMALDGQTNRTDDDGDKQQSTLSTDDH